MPKPNLWLVVNPDRLLVIPNTSMAGPGHVNIRKTVDDGAFEAPNDAFFRGRLRAEDVREATTTEIAVAKKKAEAEGTSTAPPAPSSNPPRATDPPRAS